MELPKELSIAEIRNYMLANDCKVTNHALVKHFKKFLTHPQSQSESFVFVLGVLVFGTCWIARKAY